MKEAESVASLALLLFCLRSQRGFAWVFGQRTMYDKTNDGKILAITVIFPQLLLRPLRIQSGFHRNINHKQISFTMFYQSSSCCFLSHFRLIATHRQARFLNARIFLFFFPFLTSWHFEPLSQKNERFSVTGYKQAVCFCFRINARTKLTIPISAQRHCDRLECAFRTSGTN